MSTDNTDDQDDIYRGEIEPEQPFQERPPSLSIADSISSSSSSSVAGGRIGAIAAKLELAISKWAKHVRGQSSSSPSTSSTSSISSLRTSTKSRRRRRSSVSTVQSEREIAARITRLKALHKYRQVPRKFALYLAPVVHTVSKFAPSHNESGAGSMQTAGPNFVSSSSISGILSQLEITIRRPRHRHRHRGSRPSEALANPLPPILIAANEDPLLVSVRRHRKGKQHGTFSPKPAPIPEEPSITRHQAWFLDVANPTWADLQAIGRLLHIHPLTLEDILQQDPREKVEDFPKLGYYFISFRAVESPAARERVQHEAGLPDSSSIDEGFIGEANVYLTVFNDGICCFHFTDVTEHTDRVRKKMLLKKNSNMSSDWIAHVILDSIVDSLFPVLGDIEREVMAIDHTVFTNVDTMPQQDPFTLIETIPSASVMPFPTESQEAEKSTTTEVAFEEEKYTPAQRIQQQYRPSFRPHFVSPRFTLRLAFRRAKRRISGTWRSLWMRAESSPSAKQFTLRRMARVKRLVTVLGRLLNTKADVITSLKKRLVKAVKSDTGANKQTAEELEVAIYMGDVQDHILTLQLSLAHNERMLAESQSAYMSHLRSQLELTKCRIDMKVLLLTIITLTVICIQTLTGIFSMNITVPHNRRNQGGRYVAFSLVLAGAATIMASMFLLVRYWWKTARRRRGPPL